ERLADSVPMAPEGKPRRFALPRWLPRAAALAGVAALAAAVAIVAMRPGEHDRLASEVLASHVRATLSGRSYDIASSDQHTVKPLLSARLPFPPPGVGRAAEGF